MGEIASEPQKPEELSAEELVQFAKDEGFTPAKLDDLEKSLAQEQKLEKQKQELEDQKQPIPEGLEERLSTVEEEVDELRRHVASEIDSMLEEREPVDDEDLSDPEGDEDGP